MKARYLTIAAVLVWVLGAPGGAGAQGGADSLSPWGGFKLNPKTRVKLDFRNASVDAILQTLTQASGIAIIKDPTLTTPMTLQSPQPQTLNDAFAMLNAALSLRNYDLRRDGNFLVIRARAQQGRAGRFGGGTFDPSTMANMGVPGADGGRANQNVLRVYPLKFAAAATVARTINEVFAGQTGPTIQLGPMMLMGGGPGGRGGRFGGGNTAAAASGVRASAEDFSNSVIVNAPAEMHQQINDLIQQIDRETDQPQQTVVYKLEYASASDLITTVQYVLNSNAPRGRGATTSGGGFPFPGGFRGMGGAGGGNASVSADTRSNSLIVSATKEVQESVGPVIKELDKPVVYETNTFVLTLKNARADTVADLVNSSFSGARGGTRATGTSGRINTNANRNTNRRNTNSTLGGNRNSRQAPTTGGRAADVEGGSGEDGGSESEVDGTEIAQFQGFGGFQGFQGGQRNTRTATAGQVGYDDQGRIINVRDLSGEVTAIADVSTNSVIIVTSPENRAILEQILAQLDRIPEQVMIETLIVEASLDTTNKLGVEWGFTSGNSAGTSAFGDRANTAQPQGLRYTLTGAQYNVFLQALQTDSRFEVLSTPRIFTSNNAAAEINISQSLPYVLSSREDANGNLSYSYSFLDVGIVLSVTPRITSNGYVTMDVTQTANDFVNYTSFNAPIVNQREAETTVSVRDGETIVLGGIIKSSVSETKNKVPILGDIPILGGLFKSTNRTKNKTELLVFLTPHVVRDEEEARRLREWSEKDMQSQSLQQMLKSRQQNRLIPMRPADPKPEEPGDAKPETGADPGKVTPPGETAPPAEGKPTDPAKPGEETKPPVTDPAKPGEETKPPVTDPDRSART